MTDLFYRHVRPLLPYNSAFELQMNEIILGCVCVLNQDIFLHTVSYSKHKRLRLEATMADGLPITWKSQQCLFLVGNLIDLFLD